MTETILGAVLSVFAVLLPVILERLTGGKETDEYAELLQALASGNASAVNSILLHDSYKITATDDAWSVGICRRWKMDSDGRLACADVPISDRARRGSEGV